MALMNIGTAHYLAGRVSKTRTACERLLTENPDSVQAKSMLQFIEALKKEETEEE